MEDIVDLVFNLESGEFCITPSESFEDMKDCIFDDTEVADIEKCECVSFDHVQAVPTIDEMEEHIKLDEKPYSEDD